MRKLIVINGLPLENEDELREQINPLMTDLTDLEDTTEWIISVAIGDKTEEEFRDVWSNEPVVLDAVKFVDPPGDRQTPMEMTHASVGQAISQVAASGLMAGYEDKVLFVGNDGMMVINPENPPTLTESYEITNRLFLIKDAASKLEEFSCWQMGSWFDSCETTYGEEYSISQICNITEESYNKFVTYMNTFRAFRNKRYKLSFTHHREAFYRKLDEDAMHEVLGISEKLSLTCAEQRKLMTYCQNTGLEYLDEEDLSNKEALMMRINVRDPRRNYIFHFEGVWRHHRGTRSALPVGAQTIMCTDNWCMIDPATGEEAEPLPRWETPGTIHESARRAS